MDHPYVKPLEIIFISCLESVIFPTEWKKPNVVPVNKSDKQSLANYRAISLLLIYGKIFELFLYDEMFDFSHNKSRYFHESATDMRCFARSKFSRSLVHKKKF